METTFVWAPRKLPRWFWPTLVLCFLVAVLVLLGEDASRDWFLYFYFTWAWSYTLGDTSHLYVFSHGLLVGVGRLFVHEVPLRAAQPTRRPTEWYFRWTQGRCAQSFRVKPSPEFDAALQQALAASQERPAAANPGEVLSVAARATPFTPGAWAPVLLMFAALGLAAYFDQPLVLLALLAVPVLADRAGGAQALVLTPDDLWIVERGKEPIRIERALIESVDLGRWSSAVIRTRHPAATTLKIRTTQWTGTTLVERLKRGDRRVSPAALPAEPAQPGGHGLAGKARPPM